jgi:enterochelin esterase-like enzyme
VGIVAAVIGMGRVGWRRVAALAAAATVVLGLTGTFSYGKAYWQHRGFARVAPLSGARSGRLLTARFYSAALHRRSDYLVYLPPGYSRARRYPVYYLLHGAPGSPQDFISVVSLDVQLSNRLSEHQLRPMILVMPDGRIKGNTFSDSEWANTPAGNVESYVLDVVRNVDRRFAAIPSRAARVIAGYSMGGYGALNIALHHLSVFANVQSWSGYFVQSRKFSPVFARASAADLAYNSPLDYARTLARVALARYPLRVYMFTGQSDPDGRGIGQVAAELRRAGAVVSYNLYPGGHDWQVWYGQVDPMMLMASRTVTHPLPAAAAAPSRSAGQAPNALYGAHRAKAPADRAAPIALARPVLVAARPYARVSGTKGAHLRPVRDARGLAPVAWLGLMLAVASAALINLGFLLQQRGLVHTVGDGLRGWLGALRSPTWLAGQAVGWLGFAIQIVAVALAPLSLVEAFAAGGLAFSVPLAAGIFGHRVPRLQVMAVTAVAAGLAPFSALREG